jgi:NAD(P)-dependent dehydrogenase (short-subunit alcohol dehydrogenase family)
MGINHFAPMLLALKLAPLLRQARAPRVVSVASGVHFGARLDLDDLDLARGWSPYGSYAASKLANVLFAAELPLRPEGKGLLSFSLHPGVISTKLLHKGFGGGGASLESGALSTVHCATAPGLEPYQGGFFSNSSPTKPNPLALDPAFRAEFWDRCAGRLNPWL